MGASKKPKKQSGHEQVVEYMNQLDHPLKAAVEEARNIILSTNERITEHIKWKAPSFCYNGEDRVTVNLHSKGVLTLVFHCGAKVKENVVEGHLFEDTTGMLEWVTGDRATVKFTDLDDVLAKKEELAEVVTKWLEATSSQ